MGRLRIGVDADSTMYDLLGPWLRLHAERTGATPSVESLTSYHLHRCMGPGGGPLPPEEAEVFQGLLDVPGLFEGLPLLHPSVPTILEGWVRRGLDVYVVSAPPGPLGAAEKLRAFERDLPFLLRQKLILAHHKHLLDVDVIIDDSPDVVSGFSQRVVRLGIEWPWNAHPHIAGMWTELAPSWRDPGGAWTRFDEIVGLLAGHRP